MAYIGKAPNTAIVNQATSQSFSGNGSTTAFTLTRSVNVGEDLEVFVENVQQEPGSGKSYTASGTTLTFDEAPPSGTNNIYVIYRGEATINPRLEHDANSALAATTGTFSGAVSGTTGTFTQLNSDNIRVDGNTISSTDTNGDITLDPNGTGDTIVASGNLGVGTTSPSQEIHGYSSGGDFSLRLESGSATGTAYTYYKNADQEYQIGIRGSASDSFQIIDTTADAARIVMDTSGDVGIGTTSPNAKLDVEDTAGSLGSSKEDTAEFFRNDGTYGPRLQIRHSTTGTDLHHTYSTGASNLTFSLANTERMRIDGSGNVGVAPFSFSTTTGIYMTQTGRLLATCGQDAALALSRRTNNGPIATFYRDTALIGNISITTSSVSYNTTSDHRAKENVADMTGAIDRVKALAPKRFNFIVDPDTTVDGFLAHEAMTVVPEAISGTHNEVETWTQQQIDDGDAPDGTSAGDNKLDEDGNTIPKMQGIDQSKLVPLLTGALQEAIAKIETLETEMTALKARVTALEDA